MSLRRVSQADLPLTTAEARDQCRVIGDSEDETLSHLIEAATGKIASMTGLILAVETWELTITDPIGAVSLPIIPVVGLVSVNGSTDLTGYTLKIDGDCATVSGDWPEGDVVIRFTAGGDVQPELKQAIRILIAQWFHDREATGEQTVEIPYAVESLVSDFRRGWVKA